MKAIWNDQVVAESDDTVVVEGNHYFRSEDARAEFLEDSSANTTCPWKGVASYYDVVVDGTRNDDAAWCYPEPKDAAKEIRGRIAFWKDVRVTE